MNPAASARECAPDRVTGAWQLDFGMTGEQPPEVSLRRCGQRRVRRWRGLAALLILTHPCLRRLLWSGPQRLSCHLELSQHEASRVILAAAAVHLALRQCQPPPAGP